MQVKFVEATQGAEGGPNWGKFAVCRFTEAEWQQRPELPSAAAQSLLAGRGWSRRHVWVLDLQTGEGACLMPGGLASADLDKHQVWVCPMFEPFLEWLYEQDLTDLAVLPGLVELPDAEFSLRGHRRPGPPKSERSRIISERTVYDVKAQTR